MLRITLLLLLNFHVITLWPQRVLHFTRTSGFDHNTRAVSFAMFSSMGSEIGVEVLDDADGSTFSDPAALLQIDVIVFANTSGDQILDLQQQANFEEWIAQGGNVMGIHAATDTYRHSSANGNNTGAWDFYAELIGGSVQADPNHVAGTPLFGLHHLEPHPSTANLPDPWQKEEEYYYWENGYLHPQIVPVLEVEQTIGPNGQVNSYDAPRPMSWYRIIGSNRVFYTALGHATSNYTSDLLFRQHVKDALMWLLEEATSIDDPIEEEVFVSYDPITRMIEISNGPERAVEFQLFDLQGKLIHISRCEGSTCSLRIGDLNSGIYLLRSEGLGFRVAVW